MAKLGDTVVYGSVDVTQNIIAGNRFNLPIFTTNPTVGMVDGDLYYNSTDTNIYRYNGSSWVDSSGSSDRYIEIRLLPSTISHTVYTSVGGDFRCPSAMTVNSVGAYVDTAGTTSVTTIDMNEAGSTFLSTKISIDATEKSSETAASPVISSSSIAADAILTFDVDAIASGTAGKGLVVWMKVTI